MALSMNDSAEFEPQRCYTLSNLWDAGVSYSPRCMCLGFNIKIFLFRIHFIPCDFNTSLYTFILSSWPRKGIG